LTERVTNAQHMARAAAENEASDRAKAAKRFAPPKEPGKPRAKAAPRAPARIKIVWAVGRTGAEPLKRFPYPERAAADAEAARIGKGCVVTPLKVPME